MNTEIFVTADENGNVIIQTNNPEVYYVKLIQYRMEVNRRGFVNRKPYVTFLKGSLENLRSLGVENKKTLPGNIVVEESTSPFGDDPSQNLKKAGNTGIVLYTVDGEPIYRQTFWDKSGTERDILIAHANGDEIKAHIKKNTAKPKKKTKKVSELKADASTLLMDFDSMKKEDITIDDKEEEVEELVIPEVVVKEDDEEEYEEEVVEVEDDEEEYLFEI
jgi:hypothetical protein